MNDKYHLVGQFTGVTIGYQVAPLLSLVTLASTSNTANAGLQSDFFTFPRSAHHNTKNHFQNDAICQMHSDLIHVRVFGTDFRRPCNRAQSFPIDQSFFDQTNFSIFSGNLVSGNKEVWVRLFFFLFRCNH